MGGRLNIIYALGTTGARNTTAYYTDTAVVWEGLSLSTRVHRSHRSINGKKKKNNKINLYRKNTKKNKSRVLIRFNIIYIYKYWHTIRLRKYVMPFSVGPPIPMYKLRHIHLLNFDTIVVVVVVVRVFFFFKFLYTIYMDDTSFSDFGAGDLPCPAPSPYPPDRIVSYSLRPEYVKC